MLDHSQPLSNPKFKLSLLALLSLNAAVYAAIDTWISAIDAVSWLGLVVTYELESFNGQNYFGERTLHAVRNALIAVIVVVFFCYLHDSAWLDLTNELLWFVLIALLELEVRRPDIVLRHQQTYWLATIAVFTGVIVMVAVWLWQSSWLDAYDAVLWIAAFALIEVDIFHFLKRKRG